MSRWLVGSVGIHLIPVFVEQLPGAIMALGPVAYWKMDEVAGPTAVDSTGNGHTGVYSADVAFGDRRGATGHPVPNFWKTTSLVTAPNASQFSLPNDITVICLAQETNALIGASPSGFTPFIKGGPSPWEWVASFPSFHSFANEGNTAGSFYQATEDVAVALGLTFGFYVWQYPASGAPVEIYHNNVGPLGSLTISPTGTRQGASATSLFMGGGHGNLTTHNSGKGRFMCHAAVYDRLLTPTEMTSIYTAKVHDGW